MYELIVLSLLMRTPFHGYLIVKIANDMFGPWAKISSGTLYPLLGRMERAGLIMALPGEQTGVEAHGERQARTFAITEEGRKRFHQVMMDMSSNLGDYPRTFQYKTAFIDLIEPKERLLLFNHFINYCQTSILHFQTERANLTHELAQHPNPIFLQNVVKAIQHAEQRMQGELDWVRELYAEELARQESSPPGETLTGGEKKKFHTQ